MLDAIEKLRISREEIERGLEPDSEGQLWLIITMQTAEVGRDHPRGCGDSFRR